MKHCIRAWISVVIVLCLQSCDALDERKAGSGELVFDNQASLKLSAPSILRNARADDVRTLAVEVNLLYTTSSGVVDSVESIKSSESGGQSSWQLGLDVPANTPFELSMTWYEDSDPRLDLIRLTRTFEGFSNSGQVKFSYDFSSTGQYSNIDGDPDYAGFNDDGDSMTNLEEWLALTDPFSAGIDDFPPLLATPSSLNIKALANASGTEILVLSNTGSATRDFTITSDSAWLTLSTDSGEIPSNASSNIEVTYSCEDSDNVFTGSIDVQSNGVASQVPVELDCQDVIAPLLSTVPPELMLNAEISGSVTSLLSFRNTGNAALNYNLNSDSDWLTTSVESGVVAAGMTEQIEVSAACGATVETRTGLLSLQSDGGNESISIQLVCSTPQFALVVRQETLNLNAQIGAQATNSFIVQNIGASALDFSTAAQEDWLSTSPENGTIPANDNTVLSVSALCETGITSPRTNTLTITSNSGTATLSIVQNCIEASQPVLSDVTPALMLTAKSGGSEASEISLSNSGNSTLTYEVSGDVDWLSVEQEAGSIGSGASVTIPFVARCGNFIGNRSGKLDISSDGGGDSVEVSLTCEGAKLSAISPQSIDLSIGQQQSAQDDISFSNVGNLALNFTIAADRDWIIPRVTEGQLQPDATQRVGISASCGSTVVTRSGTVTVSSDGGDDTVSVTQTCTAPIMALLDNVTPSLSLTAQSGENATSTITFDNVGEAELSYEVTSDSTWLIVEANTGTVAAGNTASVPVLGQCVNFTGDRNGKLSVKSNGGNKTVNVSLTCTATAPPALSGVTADLTLTAQTGQSANSTIELANSGNATLDYQVNDDSTWLTLGKSSGSIAASDETTVGVEASCRDFTGNRDGKINITKQLHPESILEIQEMPHLPTK